MYIDYKLEKYDCQVMSVITFCCCFNVWKRREVCRGWESNPHAFEGTGF